ncbi:conjugal transfer protein TraD [Rhizobium panacihumi]|uniref:conjugal transfer protein TraD n=1 Tax=Rhizobium panacihumi TaxID=2008450 RepID=UPI003D78E210
MQTARTEDRKKDTREKIQLGGLVVKAGLREMNKAVLLGWLGELAERLKSDPGEWARLEAIGKKGFEDDGQKGDAPDHAGSINAGGGDRDERD